MLLDNALRLVAWLTPASLLAAASYLQASGVTSWLRAELTSHKQPTHLVAALPPSHERAPSTAPTPETIGTSPTAARTEPVPAALADPCPEQMSAHATVVDGEHAHSMAVLRWGDEGRAAVVRAGDRVGRYEVWHVGREQVWLSLGDQLCQVGMTQAPRRAHTLLPSVEARPIAAVLPPDVAGKVKRSGADSVEVDRLVREWALEDPARALHGSRIVPSKHNGVVTGYRVQRLAAGSLPAMLGLREGDVVEAINGADLTDPQVALGLYARLPYMEQLRVRVLRDGAPVTLDVRVR